MSSPTREGAVIADDLTYIGQTQIIGGTANTATPPTVNVGTMPAVTISSAQIVGGALNTATPPKVITDGTVSSEQIVGGSLNAATPPYSIPVNQAVGAGVSQRTVAPSFIPIGLEGAGHTNATNPPLMQTLGSSGAVAPSSIQPVGAGAGTDNSTNQPRVQTIGGDATFPSSAQPVGGALNTATPPTVNVGTIPAVTISSAQIVGGALNTATPPTVIISQLSTTPITLADTASIDAYSRLRSSSINTLFDGKFRFDKLPLLYDEQSLAVNSGTGTVTFVPNDACVKLEIVGGGFKSPSMTSHQKMFFKAGQSLLIFQSFVGTPNGSTMTVGLNKKIGYYDKRTGGNGIYLLLQTDASADGALPSFGIDSTSTGAPSATVLIPQPNWNQDKLDGTGPSGITINFNYAQILVMDLQLTGRVRFGFDIGGIIIWAHYENHTNLSTYTTSYMSTVCLPVRAEIYGANAGAMLFGGGSVLREGGEVDPSYRASISTESFGSNPGPAFPDVSSATGPQSLIAVRLKTGFQGAYSLFSDINVTNTSSQQIYWEAVIVRGLPQASALFAWTSQDYATEFSLSVVTNNNLVAALNVATVFGVIIRLDSGILFSSGGQRTSSSSANVKEALQVISSTAVTGSSDILLIRGRGMGGAGTGHISLGYDEYY